MGFASNGKYSCIRDELKPKGIVVTLLTWLRRGLSFLQIAWAGCDLVSRPSRKVGNWCFRIVTNEISRLNAVIT